MTFRPFTRWIGATLLLAAIAATPAAASTASAPADARHICPGAIDVPVRIEMAAPDGAIAPGSTVNLEGTLTADVDLADVALSLSTEGSIRLLGPPELALGPVQQGARKIQIPVQFMIPRALGPANAAVVVVVKARNAETGAQYQKQDGVYAVTRGGQFRAAPGAYVTAQIKAINQDLSMGLITVDDAATETQAAASVDGTWNQDPSPSFTMPSDMGADRAVLDGVGPLSAKPIQPQIGPNRITSGNVTFNGNVAWLASDASAHPAYGTTVTVWEIILGVPVPVAFTATQPNGNYSMNVFVVPLSTCFVTITTTNTWVQITPVFPLPVPYAASSPSVFDPAGGSTITNNFVAANTGTGPSLGLHSMVTYEAAFTASRNSGVALGLLPILWPGTTGAAFYDGVHINLRPLDRYAYDVMYHEWGHYVMDSFNFENNPGGSHNIGDCIAQKHSSKDFGLRLAWGEGWPTYWGTTAQQAFGLPGMSIPTVGDNVYTDTEAGNFSYSLEFDSGAGQDNLGRGEDNEIAVQRVLWDLVDSNNDNHDQVTASDQTLLNLFRGTNLSTFSQAWGLIRGTLSDADQLSYGAITTDALIGPSCTTPANNAVVTPTQNSTFVWKGNVGCPSSYSGDQFSLRFFTMAGTPVMSIGPQGSTSHTLTGGELATLVAAGHNLRWAVEGSNTQSPATGPYLGENRTMVVDRPPVANAGPDQPNVECASTSTTPVQLDGSGSSDPDGDPLTYTWSAPGVTFNDPHAQKPIGQFHEGSTVVTLVVSDGLLTDQAQVTIRVVDTTPPTVSCPTDLTLECDSHCDPSKGGVPATDATVVAWLASFTASDICDANPILSLNNPACFPLGDTPVTFTATDHDGNASSCTRTVHVVDTTPPTIAVSLDRTVLWPPNHKLVTINATVNVADVCDPNPFFQLMSIASNEPDNGLGDGDTADDIQGAGYGTPDTQFQLRSERSGLGSGRRYTITYRAFDHSGNHADAVAVVRVPHDQAGAALAADGMSEDGTGFAPNAATFAVVVRSLPLTTPGTNSDISDTRVGGGTTTGGTDLLFNTRMVDETQAYVGNGAGALKPVGVYRIDANGDGLEDLVCVYQVADAQALLALSTPEDGPLGLHYNTRFGADYLVNSIFTLGTPIVLPDLGTETVGGTWHGGRGAGAGSPGQAADAQAKGTPTAEATQSQLAPATTELSGVYPNPVRQDAVVAFSLATEHAVELTVYDVRGARVRTIENRSFAPGRYQVKWDGRDEQGRRLEGGVYFVRFHAGSYQRTLKTVMMP